MIDARFCCFQFTTLMSPVVRHMLAVARHHSPQGRGCADATPSEGLQPMSQLWKSTSRVLFTLAIAAAQRSTVAC